MSGLSELLGIDLNLAFGKGQEAEMAAAAFACAGPVLIAWDQRKIFELAAAIAPDQSIPVLWPSERFDVVFVFHLTSDGTYTFSQVPQLILAGDTGRLSTGVLLDRFLRLVSSRSGNSMGLAEAGMTLAELQGITRICKTDFCGHTPICGHSQRFPTPAHLTRKPGSRPTSGSPASR